MKEGERKNQDQVKEVPEAEETPQAEVTEAGGAPEVTETPQSAVTEAEEAVSPEQALEEEKARADRYLANWRRAEADFDNYKKRVEQDRSETARFANMSLIIGLLPVIDDFGRAFNTLPSSLAGLTWIDGIRLIDRKLQATLEARGLTEIKSVGEQFDPLYHEAVMQMEGEEGKVIAELQRGYKLYDRVIRPALVVVGKAPEKSPEEAEAKAEEVDERAGEVLEGAEDQSEEEGGGAES